jgi:MinD-like ATPase involved in chromosome partitioning or flagellar assembly
MDQVAMNDGLDGRETVAFGLGAAEVAVFVLALLTGYAALRSGLPGVVEWALAGLLVTGGALLAWGRMAGRSMLEWAVLLARFAIRAHCGRAMLASQTGAVVVPLALRRHLPGSGSRGEAAAPRRRARIEAFFSLNGGSGRTTLAVEVAALLAARNAAARRAGAAGIRVALVDLTTRSPAVALRLGLPLPAPPQAGDRGSGTSAPLVTHATGLLVHPGAGAPPASDAAALAWVSAVVDAAEGTGADLIVADIDCDLTALCVDVLRRCDRVHVTLTASAGGVLDAYRSTAELRRLGLRDRIDYVVNRCAGPIQLGEVMSDLDGVVVAEVPQSAAFVTAENQHRIAALDDRGPAAAAITRLAEHVQTGRDAGADMAPRCGAHAG